MHSVRSELVNELLATRDAECDAASTAVLLQVRRRPANAHSPSLLAATASYRLREDSDGDVDPPRRQRPRRCRHIHRYSPNADESDEDAAIMLETMAEGTASTTGVQLWRASFLLAEYLQSRAAELNDTTVLELGCGVGLVAVAAARSARTVYATDGDVAALTVCERNVQRNTWARERVRVRHLQWTSEDDDLAGSDTSDIIPERLRFTSGVPSHMTQHLDWIVASDVFYDDDVTELFLDTLYRIMQHHPTATVIVAAEKRVVFSAFTLTEISLGYDALQRRQCLHTRTEPRPMRGCIVACRECNGVDEPSRPRFLATPIPVASIPPVYDYDRVSTLAIWQLHAVLPL